MSWIKKKWDGLSYSTRAAVRSGLLVLTMLAFIVGFAAYIASYDGLEDPMHHGTIRCQPVSAQLGYCENEQGREDFRCYNGRFRTVMGHDGEGVIFYDENRRRVQLSNVSCIVQYDIER